MGVNGGERERIGGRGIRWGEDSSLVDLYHKEMEARDPHRHFGMRDARGHRQKELRVRLSSSSNAIFMHIGPMCSCRGPMVCLLW